MEKRNDTEYELFNKFSIDALESLETILKYSDKNMELYSVIGNILNKKYEEEKIEFEGMDEYDTICRVLNFNLAEIKSNVDSMSKEELFILKELLDTAINKISPELIEATIVHILEENVAVINSKLPDDLSDKEIYNLLCKCSILELDAIYTIVQNAEDMDRVRICEIIKEEYKRRHFKNRPYCHISFGEIEHGLYDLLENISKFNLRELKFLEPLTEDASIYISSRCNKEDVNERIMLDNFTKFKTELNDTIEFEKNNSKEKTLTRY